MFPNLDARTLQQTRMYKCGKGRKSAERRAKDDDIIKAQFLLLLVVVAGGDDLVAVAPAPADHGEVALVAHADGPGRGGQRQPVVAARVAVDLAARTAVVLKQQSGMLFMSFGD